MIENNCVQTLFLQYLNALYTFELCIYDTDNMHTEANTMIMSYISIYILMHCHARDCIHYGTVSNAIVLI